MIDHLGFAVTDLAASKAFYDKALAPLGFTLIMSVGPEETGGGAHAGYGSDGKAFFWIGDSGPRAGAIHVAFSAEDRGQVDAFHAAALAAGGRDNGAPGVRHHYHPNHYAAFVLDPDGMNIEAVCHKGA